MLACTEFDTEEGSFSSSCSDRCEVRKRPMSILRETAGASWKFSKSREFLRHLQEFQLLRLLVPDKQFEPFSYVTPAAPAPIFFGQRRNPVLDADAREP